MENKEFQFKGMTMDSIECSDYCYWLHTESE